MKKTLPLLQQGLQALLQFSRLESFAGILLVLISVCALIVANSPLLHWYDLLIQAQLYIGINDFKLAKPLLHWINDGLMAIYFLLIGLELKREVLEGQLSKPSQIILPGAAAVGGVVIPALIYFAFNHQHKVFMTGWAIPTATDIAFALGVLALLGKRIPSSLKIYLMTIAIFDDFFGIIVIALLYTSTLSTLSLTLASIAIVALIICNRLNVASISIYCFIGVMLWFFVLKSGVHATLAGVILAFTIPNSIKEQSSSPLKEMEHKLHPWVVFFIIPLFAFANSGIHLSNISIQDLSSPLTLGITLGLFFGKQIGIFSFSFLLIKLKIANFPDNTNWKHLYGAAVLGGIGFTMSLFMSSLAFEQQGDDFTLLSRIGILIGSFSSAIVGYFILRSQQEKQV